MIKKKEEKKGIVKKEFEFLKFQHPIFEIQKTLGQKAADTITKWAGSWTFIILFFLFLAFWMAVNTYWIIFGRSWDPYPFILLNLALSCLAAIQAPIILMSQNREAQKDRLRAQYDYAVNRRSERKIEGLQDELREIRNLLIGKKNKK